MKIKDYPDEILELIIKRTKEINGRLPDIDDSLTSCFDWSRSAEGHRFWENLFRGDLETFYKKYPKEKPEINNIILSKNITVYKVKSGLNEYEVTIKKL